MSHFWKNHHVCRHVVTRTGTEATKVSKLVVIYLYQITLATPHPHRTPHTTIRNDHTDGAKLDRFVTKVTFGRHPYY